jgi:phage tail tape-measure protein
MNFGENEDGTSTSAVSGALSGAAIGAAGGPGGIALGALIGALAMGTVGNASANRQRRLKEDAAKKARLAQRSSIVKEINMKQQADAIALSKINEAKGGGAKTSSTPSAIGSAAPTTAGTF